MKRGTLRIPRLVAIPAVVLGALLVLGAARFGFSRLDAEGSDVPTFEVRSEPFARVIHAEGEVKPVRSTAVNAPREGRRHLIGWLAEDGKTVKKGELLVRFDNEEAVRELADGRDDEQAADARIAKEKVQIANALNQRARAAALTSKEIAQVKQLGKKDPRYFSRSEVIESEIDEGLLQARLEQTQGARKAEERLGRSRVALLSVERRKAAIETEEAARELAAMEVRAPHDGVFIVERHGWEGMPLKTGDRAWRGMRLGEVARNDRMDAAVQVLEADAGGLAPGRGATVWLDAQPDVSWKAKVKRVDPFPQALHPENPTQYFGALLEISGDTSSIKPGQRLRARIVLEKMDAAMVVPRQAVHYIDKGTFAFRQSGWGKGFELVPVELGPGTVGRVVVKKGLRPGDRIALRDPRQSAEEVMAPEVEEEEEEEEEGAPGSSEGGGEGRGSGRRGGGR